MFDLSVQAELLAFGRELGQKRSLQSWIMEFAETQIQKEGFHE